MNELTRDFFIKIGVSDGMTVLDVGCGGGVTTEILSEIVGTNGKVIGVDPNQKAINLASKKSQSNNLKNVEYVCSDIFNYSNKENEFDAIVGRRVLMYLPNPKDAISQLSSLLKSGGIMGFQEHDSTSIINKDKMPLHFKANQWIWELVKKNGGNIHIGKELWSIFSHYSLTIQNIKSEAIIQSPNNNISLVPTLQSLSRLLLANKIVSEEELSEKNLYVGLESERKKSDCLFIREMIFFISTKKIAEN